MDDSALFGLTPQALLDGLKSASIGGAQDPEVAYVLQRGGLLDGQELTEPGRGLFRLAFVLRRQEDAQMDLAQALRVLTPIQVIEQELRGLGAVPEDGVIDLLRQHRAIALDVQTGDLRPLFRWLNKTGVLVYSQKLKTVRSLAPAPEAALAGEVQAIAAMISPRTPYRNIVKLRRVIRPLRGVIWWADPHFAARALEELAEELESEEVSEIRILSGDQASVLNERSGKDFKRFANEMATRGVSAEWRTDPKRDWHDRWLADDKTAWNVPPVNTLFKNDYSEITPASERPPFEEWWSRSAPRPLA